MKELQNLIDISTNALKDVEKNIRLKYNTPSENIDVEKFRLIGIPENYIRSAAYYKKEYNLYELIKTKNQRDNIAYSLQLSDLFNYFLNRFNIFLSVGALFRKQAIINIVSIQEGVLKCSYNDLRNFCIDEEGNTCPLNSNCEFYLKSLKQIRNNGLLDNYRNIIQFYDPTIFEKLKEQKGIRDKIHIHEIQENELHFNDDYARTKYNESIKTLQYLKKNLLSDIDEFRARRISGCKKISS
ncbi:hypothetical protein [Zobellia sp. 1_MG-2023]|uniref:hypothetical protein n=1 Tax=Zobellia sp. 1_MG-2023 TaxID=3062626 RepID=UPI0026E3749E|nr:hypothetical protein [Zobellia sp. 1_MG-2023]MDO6820265.1 hypothetical protein [Zobellia sp. 1_MG-2023]